MTAVHALLLTDVVDSTLLNDRLGDAAMASLWAAHDRAARDLIRKWGGTEVGRSDGFLVLFPTAAGAVDFALAYHRCLGALEPPLRARVGIHLGPITLRENSALDTAQGATPYEVDGVALPAAARVMGTALGGQTLLSRAAAQGLGPAPWCIQSHGHWRMKGLAEPLELFEVGEPGGALFGPPADSTKAYRVVQDGDDWLPAGQLPHNLPAEQDAFVGRRETLHLLATLFDGGARLVTLLGIGGIGKTRLALRFARGWLGEFPGGAWFCDLSSARTVDGIVHSLAQALDVPLGKADPLRQLGAAIAGRGRCLVIVDNFEQVAAHARATIGAWLEAAPEASFLVTSRELLGLPGERAVPLDPLSSTEARDMFRQHMAASMVASPTTGDDDAIASLVELIDRLPLAIALAAARARVMSPRDQLLRMSDRFKLLVARSGRSDRQATMRAALDWGWDLLPADEQSALAQLSVFTGGFAIDAAEAVIAVPDAGWVPDLLQALIEKSWLRRSSQGRFDMLATVRHYCTDQLQLSQGPAAPAQVRRRHWSHFAGFDDARATAGRCAEMDNLMLGCQHAMADRDDAAAIGCLLGAWAALRLTGPLGAALTLAQACLGLPDLAEVHRSGAHWVAGSALYLLGQIDPARSHLLDALALSDPRSRLNAAAACALGELESTAGDSRQAEVLLTRSLGSARQRNDVAMQCRALNGLGALASDRSRWDEAQEFYSQGLALARHDGQTRWEGVLLGNLGTLHHMRGRPDPAAEHYEEAIAIAQKVGDRRGEGDRRSNLGLLHLEQKRPLKAQAELQLALAIAQTTGHLRLQGVVACNLGLAWEAEGDLVLALAAFEESVQIAEALGDARTEGQCSIYRGRVLARLNRTASARTCLAHAQTRLAGSADPLLMGVLLCAQAELAIKVGEPLAADQLIGRAQGALAGSGGTVDSELGLAIAFARQAQAEPVNPG